MKSLVLQAQSAPIHFTGQVPRGLVAQQREDCFEGKVFRYEVYRFPEAGPPLYFTGQQLAEGLVVPIAGRRWRVQVHVETDRHDDYPEGAAVIFTPTEEEETPSQSWDESEKLREMRAAALLRLGALEKELACAPDPETRRWTESMIRHEKNVVERIEAGDLRLRSPHYVQMFGQPNFIQNEIFPVYEGRCAMHLMTLETEWGDCGNINLMFHVDAEGVPCALWFEASCA